MESLAVTSDRLRCAAWSDLDLATRDVARLAQQGTRLHANRSGRFQRAGDVLDLAERVCAMQAIASAYARLYLRAPRLLWAGDRRRLSLPVSRPARIVGVDHTTSRMVEMVYGHLNDATTSAAITKLPAPTAPASPSRPRRAKLRP